MKRKTGKLYDKWHRRVEGQIRDCMHFHPEWFNFKTLFDQIACIDSLAKRIVGEIVADADLAAKEGIVSSDCDTPLGMDNETNCYPSGQECQFSVANHLPQLFKLSDNKSC